MKKFDNIKLGTFVLAGAVFLVFSLYMIGRNQNLFGSTFTISASFYNVNGLMPGNNVRFAGIDVGTVKRITLETDTTVLVVMVIDKKVKKFIRKNALASVGTDGLMGNKLININNVSAVAEPIEEDDVLFSLMPVETDDMLRTLNETNDNIAAISEDLKRITQKINNSTSLWKLLSDSTIARDIKQTAINIRNASQNAALAGSEFVDMTMRVKQGNGLAGTLIADTLLAYRLKESLHQIQEASNNAATIASDLKEVASKLKAGKGTAGGILADTLMIEKLQKTLTHVEEGTAKFNENMEAMRHHFLFKSYFDKKEKAKKKK
jgi:phospholipid/cholesterol/gamma-HCH transport system substrate-binding protein